LNGVIATTRPHGTRIVSPNAPAPFGAASSGSVSPRSCVPSNADRRRMCGPRPTSARDSASGLPCSRESSVATSSTCASSISAARRRISPRSQPESFAICFAPSTPAASARSTSSSLAEGTVSITSPLYGLATSSSAPFAVHSPATYIFIR
jgi:hypothetical protein